MEQTQRTSLAPMGVALLMLLTTLGCGPAPDMRDQRLADFARQSTEQQARQNEAIAKQSQAVVEESAKLAEASKELVSMDAEARREMVTAQRELNSQLNEQRANIDAGRDQLERDRRELASARHRDPILAASIQSTALIVACLLPLIVCIFVIRQMSRTDCDDGAVAELLVTELTAERPRLLPGPSLRPALEDHADRDMPDGAPTDLQPDTADLPF